MARKIIPSLCIPYADLATLTPADLRAIDGPKFITRSVRAGIDALAVLISHDKWRALNHGAPYVNPDQITEYFVGDQAYIIVPVGRGRVEPTVWQTPKESMIQIVTRRRKARK
jgi:hypothetical protein